MISGFYSVDDKWIFFTELKNSKNDFRVLKACSTRKSFLLHTQASVIPVNLRGFPG